MDTAPEHPKPKYKHAHIRTRTCTHAQTEGFEYPRLCPAVKLLTLGLVLEPGEDSRRVFVLASEVEVEN